LIIQINPVIQACAEVDTNTNVSHNNLVSSTSYVGRDRIEQHQYYSAYASLLLSLGNFRSRISSNTPSVSLLHNYRPTSLILFILTLILISTLTYGTYATNSNTNSIHNNNQNINQTHNNTMPRTVWRKKTTVGPVKEHGKQVVQTRVQDFSDTNTRAKVYKAKIHGKKRGNKLRKGLAKKNPYVKDEVMIGQMTHLSSMSTALAIKNPRVFMEYGGKPGLPYSNSTKPIRTWCTATTFEYDTIVDGTGHYWGRLLLNPTPSVMVSYATSVTADGTVITYSNINDVAYSTYSTQYTEMACIGISLEMRNTSQLTTLTGITVMDNRKLDEIATSWSGSASIATGSLRHNDNAVSDIWTGTWRGQYGQQRTGNSPTVMDYEWFNPGDPRDPQCTVLSSHTSTGSVSQKYFCTVHAVWAGVPFVGLNATLNPKEIAVDNALVTAAVKAMDNKAPPFTIEACVRKDDGFDEVAMGLVNTVYGSVKSIYGGFNSIVSGVSSLFGLFGKKPPHFVALRVIRMLDKYPEAVHLLNQTMNENKGDIEECEKQFMAMVAEDNLTNYDKLMRRIAELEKHDKYLKIDMDSPKSIAPRKR